MTHEIAPVILAAGKGSRLGFDHIPKPMAPVAGRPLMQTAVESLFQMSFSAGQISTVIGFRGDTIKEYFGADLCYCLQTTLNGNAAAVNTFLSTCPTTPNHLLIIQGDDAPQASVENLQKLIHLHLSHQADLSLLTVSRPDPNSHRVEYLCDKGDHINQVVPRFSLDSQGNYTAGIYLISQSLFLEYFPRLQASTPPEKELGIAALIRMVIESGQRVYQVHSPIEYISTNTLDGLQYLRHRQSN